MRFVIVDSSTHIVTNVRIGSSIVSGEIASDIGELGQIQQTDGSFITPPPSLNDMKTAKISQINDLYNQKLATGFSSSASGTSVTYDYSPTSQMKFMQLAILVLSGKAVFPVSVYAKDGSSVSLTQTQYDQLVSDIASFAQPLTDKEHSYIDQVNACTTVDQVNAIVVSF